MPGKAGSQTLVGGDGDDHLVGGAGNDVLTGNLGNDSLIAGGGDDVLNGGLGNDFLNGGGGNDKYVFTFSLTSGAGVNEVFRDGGMPSNNADDHAWDNYLSQLLNWRNELFQAWGPDTETTTLVSGHTSKDALGGGEFAIHPIAPFDNTYLTGGVQVMNGQGDDTIAQLTRNPAQKDVIEIHGVTATQFEAHAHLTLDDVDGDGAQDTVLTFDGSGSITILGEQFQSVQSMVTDGYFVFV